MNSPQSHTDESVAIVVAADKVSKTFGDRVAVDNLDLAVSQGGCFGLLGPNGAGKTTTLQMTYGVSRPTSGRVRVFGIDVAEDTRAVCRRLGVTLQENVLIDTISTRDNLRIFGRYYRLGEAELSRRIEELLDFLELRSHADAPARTLSGGYKRRLSVAMSLINKPELRQWPETPARGQQGNALFTDDSTAIVERMHQADGGERRPFVVRPANLEDVFLSITGTGLREGA